MNPASGHLIRLRDDEAVPDELSRLIRLRDDEALPAGYIPVPDELARAANQVLGDRDEAYVSLTSGGKLSKWAAQKRKATSKMQRESRRRNRRR